MNRNKSPKNSILLQYFLEIEKIFEALNNDRQSGNAVGNVYFQSPKLEVRISITGAETDQ